MRLIRLLLSLLILPAQSALSHGTHDTGMAHADSPRPLQLWEHLLGAAEAAMRLRVDEQGGYRYMDSDGLADHSTGRFPNSGNPHTIRSQDYNFRVALKPTLARRPVPVGHNNFGVAINGVPFDAATAEYWQRDRRSGWNYEALTGGLRLGLDRNNAHVQPNGAYHYHGLPTGVLERLPYRSEPVLIGWAADGYPIYGPYG